MITKFRKGGLLKLDWLTFEDEFLSGNEHRLDQIQMDIFYMINLNKLWEDPLDYGIVPIKGQGDIYDWIKDLSRIIKDLKKASVPWIVLGPVFFTTGPTAGILRLDGLIFHIVFQESDGQVKTDIVDLEAMDKIKLY